jgi:hypothetical protein
MPRINIGEIQRGNARTDQRKEVEKCRGARHLPAGLASSRFSASWRQKKWAAESAHLPMSGDFVVARKDALAIQ